MFKYLRIVALHSQNNTNEEINTIHNIANRCPCAGKPIYIKVTVKKNKRTPIYRYMHEPHGRRQELMKKNCNYLRGKYLGKYMDLYSIMGNQNQLQVHKLYKTENVVQFIRGTRLD